MSASRRMLKALAALLPLGALGASTALASAAARPAVAAHDGVAQRLRAIRGAVSELTAKDADLAPGDPNIRKAQWVNWLPGWGNGGWHNGGWRNGGWNNWHNGWHNGGWGNGGWHNGWHNW